MQTLELLLDLRNLVLQDSATITAALALFRSKPSLGFPDCLILQAAHRAGHRPLSTFDRNLAKLDGTQKL